MSDIPFEQIEIEKNEKTQLALKRAKEALLAYAMNYPETIQGLGNPNQGPGNFPCPDEDFDGGSESNDYVISPQCNSGGDGVLARFPWQELGLEAIRDGDNELLWYAISNNFANFAGNSINTSTVGEITIKDSDGVTILNDGGAGSTNGVIAVIIAPGKPIARQDGVIQVRTTIAEQQDPLNYLDIAYFNDPEEEDNSNYQNSDNTDGFIRGPVFDAAGNVVVNDVIEVITYEDLAEFMHIRVANDLENAINNYEINCGQWPQALGFDSTRVNGEYGDDLPAGEDPITTQGNLRVDDATWEAGGCADGLLPQWFEAEQWNLNTYYAVAGPVDCVGPACLSSDGGVTFDKQVVIIYSGRHGLGAATNDPADYFEGQNDNSGGLDLVFDENDPTPGANDFVWTMTP